LYIESTNEDPLCCNKVDDGNSLYSMFAVLTNVLVHDVCSLINCFTSSNVALTSLILYASSIFSSVKSSEVIWEFFIPYAIELTTLCVSSPGVIPPISSPPSSASDSSGVV
jgi:hypothetical protein